MTEPRRGVRYFFERGRGRGVFFGVLFIARWWCLSVLLVGDVYKVAELLAIRIMEGTAAYEVVEALRTVKSEPPQPLVLITAY